MTDTAQFTTQLAAAKAAAAAARKAVNTAVEQATISPELQALFLDREPAAYADCLRKIAVIVDNLPALRTAADTAEAAVTPLADRACWYCHGTGLYQAPTSHLTQGKPVCWKCGGTGESAKSRKAN